MGIAKSFYPLLAITLIYGLTYGLNNPITLITRNGSINSGKQKPNNLLCALWLTARRRRSAPFFFGAIAGIAGLSSVFFGSGNPNVRMHIYMASRMTGKKGTGAQKKLPSSKDRGLSIL